MTNLTIDSFWKKRLGVDLPHAGGRLVQGWAFQADAALAYKEAPLLSAPVDNNDPSPWDASILLVSAPGAVGKSTLARQIGFATGAVYVDLAGANPVGGHAITGGLATSGLFPIWGENRTTLLIDGLDEARLRVTQEAFEAFLADIAQLSQNRSIPTVLFGRTSAVQDAWLTLVDGPVRPAVLEIGFYEADDAIQFVENHLRLARPSTSFRDAELRVISTLLTRLRQQTDSEGNRFAGYAPVLQAIAKGIAEHPNAAALLSEVEGDNSPLTLAKVVTSILEREQLKLRSLPLSADGLVERLYTPTEQLKHCIARVYGVAPPSITHLSAADAKVYSDALANWVPEHPFLNGFDKPASVVFDAVITAFALQEEGAKSVAAERELSRGATANPFLSEFYFPDGLVDGGYIPPRHVGLIYASLRSRLSLNDRASLLIEGIDGYDENDASALEADVEIAVTAIGEIGRVIRLKTDQADVLRLTNYIDDVEILLPFATVEVGPGPDATFVAPVDISCGKLVTPAQTVIVERSPSEEAGVVYLETDSFSGPRVASVPVLRGGVTLKVTWPGDQVFPWTSFASSPTPVTNPALEEATRRFRKFVTAFRSHSKGSLARYQAKIEHSRMTKGTGQAVLDLLKAEGIITLVGSMYFLDADKLGATAGATYADCAARQFGQQTMAFLGRAL